MTKTYITARITKIVMGPTRHHRIDLYQGDEIVGTHYAITKTGARKVARKERKKAQRRLDKGRPA